MSFRFQLLRFSSNNLVVPFLVPELVPILPGPVPRPGLVLVQERPSGQLVLNGLALALGPVQVLALQQTVGLVQLGLVQPIV